MTPFLSIIIPIYKIKESYLRECFDSLLAQDMKDFQIIAVDDGSPDQSGDICDEYAQKDERVIVIHQENAGVSVARNAGIKAASRDCPHGFDHIPCPSSPPGRSTTPFRAGPAHMPCCISLFWPEKYRFLCGS